MTEDMDTNWFNQLSFKIDENKRSIRAGIYSVGVFGFLYALQSVYPLRKFYSAKSIPTRIIKEHIKLSGRVLRIEPGASLFLHVDHKPTFLARFRRDRNTGIIIELSSVNITSNGVAWLSYLVTGRYIDFTLLKRYEDSISCIVFYNKMNVAEELVNLGFATVNSIDFDLQNDKIYEKYYQRLLKLENKAERKRLGIWQNSKPDLVFYLKQIVFTPLYNLLMKIRYK